MTITLAALLLLVGSFVYWLVRQTVGVQPWEAQSAGTESAPHVPHAATGPRIGLGVLLAVITTLFALTISAYSTRMELGPDWRPMPEPALLWINSAILVLGSGFLQWAWSAAKRGQIRALKSGLAAGGAATVAFIGGQYLAWLQLMGAGYYLTTNPANSFFYFLTALHAVHLLGGLVAWGMIVIKLRGGGSPAELRRSVELCAVYWHYLLAVWVVLFGLVLST